MKVLINKCFGGFGLSDEAFQWLIDNKGWRSSPLKLEEGNPEDRTVELWHYRDDQDKWTGKYHFNGLDSEEIRTHPDLIEVVETLGEKANGRHASLSVVEIPNGIDWEIDEYDGVETIHEVHRSWS